jgi:hypothetical protein
MVNHRKYTLGHLLEDSLAKTRAIRLSDKEDKLIEEFLRKNSIFDFSSLARTAIFRFIANPALTLKPVKVGTKGSTRRDAHVST